eukprot:gene9319-7293_t
MQAFYMCYVAKTAGKQKDNATAWLMWGVAVVFSSVSNNFDITTVHRVDPVLIFKASRSTAAYNSVRVQLRKHMEKDEIKKCHCTTQPSGKMDTEVMLEEVIPNLPEKHSAGKMGLMVSDGYEAHYNAAVILALLKIFIKSVILPANRTPYIAPPDKKPLNGTFKPFLQGPPPPEAYMTMAAGVLEKLKPEEKMPPPSRVWLANTVGDAYYSINDDSVKSAVQASWWPDNVVLKAALQEAIASPEQQAIFPPPLRGGVFGQAPDEEAYDTDAESAPDLSESDDDMVDGADAVGEIEAKKGAWGMCRVTKKEIEKTVGKGAKKEKIKETKDVVMMTRTFP